MGSIWSRLKNAYNVFSSRESYEYPESNSGSYSYRPDRRRISGGKERTILNSICTRISLDVASIDFQHVKVDESGRYLETLNTPLNNCLTVEANIDQTGRALIQDIAFSAMDEGCVAVVPIDVDVDPSLTTGFDIYTMRTGKILEWSASKIRVRLYDDRDARMKDIWVDKSTTAIIENPFYSVMNEPNSTMARLSRKLALLDIIDEENTNGKLNMIIQLPYVLRSEAKKKEAEKRRKELERQLSQSKYGVAYADGTEKIIQLNGGIDNNMLAQVDYFTNMLMTQLGMTPEILNGTANTEVMTNYFSRVVERFATSINEEFYRKFLSKTARSRGQSIKYFRDPFKLVPISTLPDIADKFTRNEIMSSNEIRQIVGLKPVADPAADELRNKNLNQPVEEATPPATVKTEEEEVNDNDETEA